MVVPVVALALVTRNYVADEMRAERRAGGASAPRPRRGGSSRISSAPRAAQQGVGVDDNLMVWVSRLIDQDVEHLRGAAAAGHQRAQPVRVRPAADAHARRRLPRARAAATRRPPSTRERIGDLEYLVAATPVDRAPARRDPHRAADLAAAEIDEQIDTLDRRVLLAALLFILPAPASATGWPSGSPIR